VRFLEDLEVGRRFRLPDCGKTGTLVGIGPAGARVKYDGEDRTVEIPEDEDTGRKGVRFTSSSRAVVISARCLVEPL
jgi:hypothetical protein